MITTVTIAGQELDPCQVLAQVTVIHGRGGFAESSQPSSATIVVTQAQGAMPDWQTGDTITLDGPHGRVFAGRVASRSLEHDDGQGVFTITAAGPLAVLGLRKIGDTPWPQETGTARATRILTAAGTPWQVDGTVDLQVLARDVDAQPAAGLLDELAAWTSAAVFDTPTGEVVYQALSGRSRHVFPFRWMDFPPELTWDQFDPALTWDGQPPSIGQWPSPASEFPVVLPCDAVAWEPVWRSEESTIVNDIRVGYGSDDPQATVDLADADSIARHGRRYIYLDTQLATPADATARATHTITTQAEERWQIGEVTVALGRLDPATYAAVLGLVCGDQVTLQGLPQPAPAIDWTGIVEGWTYTQVGADEQLVLNLSDPLLSLVVMRWDDYPAGYRWADHPAYLTWDDLESVEQLEAAS